MGTALSSVFLYGPGAFYFYPWKPVFQLLSGDGYQVGYKFFRHDHSDATNLCLHCVSLVWQLLGNFTFLGAFDKYLASRIGFDRPVSFLTAVLWIATLGLTNAPWQTKLLSSSTIAGMRMISVCHFVPTGLYCV